MTVNKNKTYFDQGKTIPPSGRGGGYLLIFIGLLPAYIIYDKSGGLTFDHLYCLPTVIFGMWMNLATTQIYFDYVDDGYFVHRFGVFPLKFARKTRFENYDAAILKPARQRYRVAQGVPMGGAIGNPEYTESNFGLYFKRKGKFEEELILKGDGKEVIDIAKKYLVKTDLRIFMGVVKKGFEVNWEAQE